MTKLTIGLAVAISLVSIGAAHAATVSPQSGEVLIYKGNGFVPVTEAVDVAPGGQLMVRPGGTALISYAGGCAVRVGSGRIWVVQESPPCAEGNQSLDLTGRMNGGSLKDEVVVEEERRDLTPFILGGGVVAAAITLMLTRRNEHPSSP